MLTGEHEADGDMRLVLASGDPTFDAEPIPLSFKVPICSNVSAGVDCAGTSAPMALERPLPAIGSDDGPRLGPVQPQALSVHFIPQGDSHLGLFETYYSFTTWTQWRQVKDLLVTVNQFDAGYLGDGRYTEAYFSWWWGQNWAWVDHWVGSDVKFPFDVYRNRGKKFGLRYAELVYIRPEGIEADDVGDGLRKPGYYRATNYSIDRSHTLSA